MASPPDHDGAPAGSVGTARLDDPISRAEHERGLRRATLAIESVRDDVQQLAAHVVALTDELTRRLDGVEPHPAPAGTPAGPSAGTVEALVEAALPAILERIRINDERSSSRVLLGDAEDKFRAPSQGPDCEALLPLCEARCCTLHFALSSQDLDEGVIRWDHGRPYLIRQRPEDGYCVHNHPERRGCTVYAYRPRPCRQYDCRQDPRIWTDFARRELAPASPYARKEGPADTELDLIERVRSRQVALAMEGFALTTHEAERRRVERAGRATAGPGVASGAASAPGGDDKNPVESDG